MMKELVLTYPDDLPEAAHWRPDEVEEQYRLMAALKLFEIGKLSSGKAAEVAGLPRAEFLEQCARYAVSVYNYRDEEVEEELVSDLQALHSLPG